jgi:hypothetical protein
MSTLKANRYENTASSDGGINIDSAGKVGVNQSSPSQMLHVEDSGSNVYVRVTETGNTGIDFGQATNGNGVINLRDNADIQILTNGVEELRVLAAGGLTFNGDTAAANALGDYEEGTFTGSFNNTDSDATVSHGNQTGYYVKVGNLVHFSLYFDDIDISATGSNTNARIYGLPFTSLSTSQHYSIVNIIHNTILTSAAGAYVNTNSTFMIPTNEGTTTTSTFSTGTNFRLMIGGTYRAA